MHSGNLPAGDFVGALRRRIEQTEKTAFTKRDQFAVGKNRGTPAKFVGGTRIMTPAFVAFPHEFSGREFNAAETRIGFISSAERVNITVVNDRR
jgi:hypothetical protein